MVSGDVLSPKSRSSSISRSFQHIDPHPRERRRLVLQVHLPLSDTASSKCCLCKWMELEWGATTSFWIVFFLADDSRRCGQLKMCCLSTQPSCSCSHRSVGAAPAEGGVSVGAEGQLLLLEPVPPHTVAARTSPWVQSGKAVGCS